MKKIYSLALCMMMFIMPCSVSAQTFEDVEPITGYYRLINPSYDDAITFSGRYDIKAQVPNLGNAGQVIRIKTDKIYSVITEIEELQAMYDAGLITGDQHVAMLQQVMTLNSWKSGLYPLRELKVQGVDYVELINKLPNYADDAIEAYLNDEVPALYENHRTDLTLLCVFASDVINPTNLETVETFSAWVEAYLTRWRNVADFGLYLQDVVTVPEEEDAAPIPTGAYYLKFKTPVWVGNMKKAQDYINSILAQDGSDDQLDLWGSSKKRILAQIAAEYGEDSPAVKFVDDMLGQSEMATEYIIGENEDGSLYNQPLPDTFGTNGISVTAEDILRCQWFLLPVDEENPFTVTATEQDSEGNYYASLNTDFPYSVYSDNTELLYATNFDENTLTVDYASAGSEMNAANNPVVIKSQKAQSAFIPVEDNIVTTDNNVLLGTLFAQENAGNQFTLKVVDDKACFWRHPKTVPANSAYVISNSEFAGINVIKNNVNTDVVYDLMGRKVMKAEKGVYIVNGKKMVK